MQSMMCPCVERDPLDLFGSASLEHVADTVDGGRDLNSLD